MSKYLDDLRKQLDELDTSELDKKNERDRLHVKGDPAWKDIEVDMDKANEQYKKAFALERPIHKTMFAEVARKRWKKKIKKVILPLVFFTALIIAGIALVKLY